jgi:hypothetical protein
MLVAAEQVDPAEQADRLAVERAAHPEAEGERTSPKATAPSTSRPPRHQAQLPALQPPSNRTSMPSPTRSTPYSNDDSLLSGVASADQKEISTSHG